MCIRLHIIILRTILLLLHYHIIYTQHYMYYTRTSSYVVILRILARPQLKNPEEFIQERLRSHSGMTT